MANRELSTAALGLALLLSSSAWATSEKCKRLLMNAEAFGFGPTAATAQIFPEVRSTVDRLGYIGEGHTLALQERLAYDEISKLPAGASDAQVRAELRRLKTDYTHFFTSSDFRYAKIAKEEGYTVGVYDMLTWFWKPLPEGLSSADLYVAQDFEGVRPRIEGERALFPPQTHVIAPLPHSLKRVALNQRGPGALINLGGLSNPYVPNEIMSRFAQVLTQSCDKALRGRASEIVVATSSQFAADMPKHLGAATLAPTQIQGHLEQARISYMTSGLGNLIEASSAEAPVIWLPPTNDSQGQQVELLRRRNMIDWSVDWHEFTPGGAIDYFRPQAQVMSDIQARMRQVLDSPKLRQQLERVIRAKTKAAFEKKSGNLKIAGLVAQYGQGGIQSLGQIVKDWIHPSHSWSLGGGLQVRFQSDRPFELSSEDRLHLAAHLPGITDCTGCAKPDLTITHTQSAGPASLGQSPGIVSLSSNWGGKLPADFIHLLYGAARKEWLSRGIYPVHAACVGSEKEGYTLLVGAPGSGKTSVVLQSAVSRGLKVFSGDKTLITFTKDGSMEAIAGTRTITVRQHDEKRWRHVPKIGEQKFGDRVVFELPKESYESAPRVQIKKIVLVGLNDRAKDTIELTSQSALHTLYPFFMDKQREDVLVGGSEALLDGTVAPDTKATLSKSLARSLESIRVRKIVAPLDVVVSEVVGPEAAVVMPPRKILFGICGIGNGHYNRQMPVLSHLLAQGHEIWVFTYGDALAYFKNRVAANPRLHVIEVANPYFVGSPQGLDFEQTALSNKNQVDFNRINASAMSQAAKDLGSPDLVISDYELVSAQYAYAKGSQLVTLDQQSKYLAGDFPTPLAGTSYLDEVERLSMFFPLASKRLAVSFFDVQRARSSRHSVDVLPPMIRPEILSAKGAPRSEKPSVLVYVTSQQLGVQPVSEWMKAVERALPDDFTAHVFLPARYELPEASSKVRYYRHGDPRFDSLLVASHGVVSTAGHTLLSEAMFLEKPVYAIPLPLYEQQLNAHIIAQGGFGINESDLTESGMRTFVSNLESYVAHIRDDRKFLLKEPGNKIVIQKIEEMLR